MLFDLFITKPGNCMANWTSNNKNDGLHGWALEGSHGPQRTIKKNKDYLVKIQKSVKITERLLYSLVPVVITGALSWCSSINYPMFWPRTQINAVSTTGYQTPEVMHSLELETTVYLQPNCKIRFEKRLVNLSLSLKEADSIFSHTPLWLFERG